MTRKTIEGVGVPIINDFSNLRNPGLQNLGPVGVPTDNVEGIAKKKYSVITFTMAAARVDIPFVANGTVLQLIEGRDTSTTPSTPDANLRVLVRFNDQNADQIPFTPGQSIGGVPFNRIWISHELIAAKEVSFLVITDEPDNRVDID